MADSDYIQKSSAEFNSKRLVSVLFTTVAITSMFSYILAMSALDMLSMPSRFRSMSISRISLLVRSVSLTVPYKLSPSLDSLELILLSPICSSITLDSLLIIFSDTSSDMILSFSALPTYSCCRSAFTTYSGISPHIALLFSLY